jgi:hypothetical protein
LMAAHPHSLKPLIREEASRIFSSFENSCCQKLLN